MKLRLRNVLIFAMLLGQMVHATNIYPLKENRLKIIHSVLFDSFIPSSFNNINNNNDQLLQYAKKRSLAKIADYPNINHALFLLDNLYFLHSKTAMKFYFSFIAPNKSEKHSITREGLKPINNFLSDLKNGKINSSIVDLTLDQRLALLAVFKQSSVNFIRQISLNIDMFYNQAFYEAGIDKHISNLNNLPNGNTKILPNLPVFRTHLLFNKKDNILEGSLDAIIVGSGAAGSTVAHELQQHGLRILVVEAGPLVAPGVIDTTSDLKFMEGQSLRTVEDGSILLLNGEVVGGGTAVNLNTAFAPTMPMIRHRFHQWHEKKLIPYDLWSDEEIDQAYLWVEKKFTPRTIEWSEIDQNNVALMAGAYHLNIPYERHTLNSYKPGLSSRVTHQKKTSFDQLLLPAMKSLVFPATLLTDCNVSQVLIDHGRAYGIECTYQPKIFSLGILHDLYGFDIPQGSKIRILAPNIILAAGNLGSSTILLKSKISNPNIGRGFVVHPLMSLVGKFENTVDNNDVVPNTIFINHFMPTDANKNMPGYLFEVGLGNKILWSHLTPEVAKSAKSTIKSNHHMAGFSVILSDSVNVKNRIEINDQGRPQIFYHLSEDDKTRMIDGMKKGIKMLFAAGAKEVSFNSFAKPLFQESLLTSNILTPDMDVDKIMHSFKLLPHQTLLFGSQMMAGNKMGQSEKTSVVNADYQVWNTNGLYVADASIFPESMGINPMQTIYTVAKIFADRFLALKFPGF